MMTHEHSIGITRTTFASLLLLAACSGGGTDNVDGGADGGDGGSLNGDGGSNDGGTNGGAGSCIGMDEGTVCRPAANACDVAEECDGQSDDCPPDEFAASGTSCDDGLFCTETDSCDGNGSCVGTGDPCAGNLEDGDNDCSESCDEDADSCSAPDPDGGDCAQRACEVAACSAGTCVIDTFCPVLVDPAGSDGEGCGTAWGSEACGSVQGGSAEAVRQGADRVFVRQSTYTASGSDPVLSMAEGVQYYGGFEGTEAELAERPTPIVHSVLDGQGTAEHVVVGASSARLDGFTLTGGVGPLGGGMFNDTLDALVVENCEVVDNDVSTDDFGEGAGIYNVDCTDLQFTNVRIADNDIAATGASGEPSAFGAGMGNESSTATLTSVRFVGNTIAADVFGSGAGAYNFDSELTLQDVLFDGNTSEAGTPRGGGMASIESTLTLTSTTFLANRLTGSATVDVQGAGMLDRDCTSTLEDVSFEENVGTTLVQGGGYASIGEDPEATAPTVSLTDCRFIDNRVAGSGAGLFLGRGTGNSLTATLSAVQFEGNHASGGGFGGGLAAIGATVDLEGGTFRENDVSGGARTAGGGLYAEVATTTLSDVQFLQNEARDASSASGGGVFVAGGSLAMHNADLLRNEARGDVLSRGGGMGVEGDDGVTPDFPVGSASVNVSDVSFVDNRVLGSEVLGGGLFMGGVDTSNTADLEQLSFVDNASSGDTPRGSAWDLSSTAATIANVVLSGNAPSPEAGGDGTATITYGHVCAEENPGAAAEDFTDIDGSDAVERSSGSTHAFLTESSVCADTADNTTAADVYGNNGWRTLTTRMDGTLDSGAADHGRHYDPGASLWIVSFSVGVTDVSWTVQAPPGNATSCVVEGSGDFSYDVPVGDIADGSVAHEGASGLRITCTANGQTVFALSEG